MSIFSRLFGKKGISSSKEAGGDIGLKLSVEYRKRMLDEIADVEMRSRRTDKLAEMIALREQILKSITDKVVNSLANDFHVSNIEVERYLAANPIRPEEGDPFAAFRGSAHLLPELRPITESEAPGLFKSHPMYGRVFAQAEIDDLVNSHDFTRIMEALVFADRKSSLRMSISVGFYHRYGCMDGLMIHDREKLENKDTLELTEALMRFSRELFGEFRCNCCGSTEKLTVSWIKDGYEKGYLPFSPPPDDPLPGIVRARQQLARLESK